MIAHAEVLGKIATPTAAIYARRRVGLVWFNSLLFQDDAVTHLVVFHAGHETAHEHDAPSSRGLDAVGFGWIGDRRGVEALAFVADFHPQKIGGHPAGYANMLGGVEPIAVLDGVDQCFLQGQVNAEDVVLNPAVLLELLEDLVEDTSTRPSRAGDLVVGSPDPSWLGHGF